MAKVLMSLSALYHHVIDFIDEKVDKNLTYHQSYHTIDVINNASTIAAYFNFDESSQKILQAAALLHDVGYAFSVSEHEYHSCVYAREILPKYQFSNVEVEQICKMIESTKIPQLPQDQLSCVLCDADLYYLGGPDYNVKSSQLFNELLFLRKISNEKEWIRLQITFLQDHQFHTTFASETRNDSKNTLIIKLKSQYDQQHQRTSS